MTAGRSPVELLDALDALRAKATPGPWTERQDYIDGGVPDNSKTINSGDGGYVGTIVLSYRGEDNAACIVAEHNAVPALVAALRAVLGLAEELEGWRANAIRYAETHPPGVEVAQAKTRALAYQRAIAGIRAAVAAALAPEGGQAE